jgi:HPt (histidine-containing phosphotransfer) domain-containing protein
MKKIIKVDADLAELVPVYLNSRRDELERISALLKAGDMPALQVIGHKMRGSGGGYGLDFLTELGERMENSAKAGDKAALTAQAAELKDFLESVEIEFLPAQ